MLKNFMTGLILVINLAIVALVITCFFKPTLVPLTAVLILCSFSLNETLVEIRLRKIEEFLEKGKNSM